MKKLFFFSALIFSLATIGCSSSSTEQKQNDAVAPDTTKGASVMTHDSIKTDQASLAYICPCGGCPEVKEPKAGKCPKCGIDLVQEKK